MAHLDEKKLAIMDKLLTESRRNEIKREIGLAMMQYLQFVTYRLILEKPKGKRSRRELGYLIRLLKKQEILREFDLEEQHYTELAM